MNGAVSTASAKIVPNTCLVSIVYFNHGYIASISVLLWRCIGVS